ncbi:MAG: Arm DNA-binding domain-containing protein, partial [Bradyrhizobium sp.]|nr:Arm DNA-binding domain-containing protein [Bradyrhizobium sp.]
MAKIKITKRSVEALKVTPKDYIAFDTDLPGFGVRVMPSGKRFFLLQYRRHGRTRRVMIGQYGVVTAELARREATIKLGGVRGANGDPAALRDAERQSTTMKELGERFLTQYVPTRCKPSTEAEYRRSVELFLDPFFAKQHVRSVTTADVAEMHGSLSHIPYQANRTLGVLSKMMNLAETWGIRDKHTNPCEDVERFPELKRERFLSPNELQRLGQALTAAEVHQTETKYAVAAFRILLLTG